MPMWPQTLSPGSSVPHHHHPEIYHDNAFPPITVILTAVLLAIFFLGFFVIYFCRCVLDGVFSAFNNRHPPPGIPIAPVNLDPPGLDPSIINLFPTFTYSSVKDYRREDYGMECAICLCEFEDVDVLRLLTKCCHVFHQSCIDLWLGSHISCPVCRCLLDPSDEKSSEKPDEMMMTDTEQQADTIGPVTPQSNDNNIPTSMEIVIKGGEEGSSSTTATTNGVRIDMVDHPNNDNDDVVKEKNKNDDNYHSSEISICDVGRFSRSNSAGHSIREKSSRQHQMGMDDKGVQDKYTLRLPEDVKEKITRKHVQTLSCTTFGAVYEDYDDERWARQIHSGLGEISGRNIIQGDVNKV